MNRRTVEAIASVPRTGYDARFTNLRGTASFHVAGVGNWHLCISDGHYDVSHGDGDAEADVVLSSSLERHCRRGQSGIERNTFDERSPILRLGSAHNGGRRRRVQFDWIPCRHVWPHDTSIIAHGLQRYGYHNEAARLALGILDAAVFFDGRLPEAFAGFPKNLTRYPVEYPTAYSPQA